MQRVFLIMTIFASVCFTSFQEICKEPLCYKVERKVTFDPPLQVISPEYASFSDIDKAVYRYEFSGPFRTKAIRFVFKHSGNIFFATFARNKKIPFLVPFVDGDTYKLELTIRKDDPIEPAEFLVEEVYCDVEIPTSLLTFEDKMDIFQKRFQKLLKAVTASHEGRLDELGIFVNRHAGLEFIAQQIMAATVDELKGPMVVEFVGENGVDCNNQGSRIGGLTREFFTFVVSKLKDPKLGFFRLSRTNLLLLNPSNMNMKAYKFLGRVVGMAVVRGITLDLQLSPLIFKYISGLRISFDDLKDVNGDEEINGLEKLMEIPEENLKDLNINFTIGTEENSRFPLKHDGENILIGTKADVNEYIRLTKQFRQKTFVKKNELQMRTFALGIADVVPLDYFDIFTAEEMKMLISGEEKISIDDWKAHTSLDGFQSDDLTVKLFWDVLADFDQSQLSKLLRFVYAVPRTPPGGFKSFKDRFTIVRSNNPDTLVRSSTW